MEVLQRTANRGSISTGPYEIDNSVKMEPDNGERFDTGDKFTNYSSVRKFTVSAWLKRTELGVQSLIWFNVNTATAVQLQFLADDYLYLTLQDNVGNGVESYAKTSALFRDTSAWYHVVLAVDTTDGTAANRTKIYVNGVNQTLVQGNASYDTFPAQNYDVPLQTKHYLLGYDGGDNGFRGYATEFYFLDGITASPTDFGETDADSGIWKPKAYTGGFGNEGYYLDFEDASALGKDVSSNNQGNFTHYGGSAADQATDTPTNNFCTINPLVNQGFSLWSLTEGGTRGANVGANCAMVGNMAVSSGKWYWEGVTTSFSGTNYWQWGVMPIDAKQGNSADSMGDAGTAWYSGDNAFYTSTSASGQSVSYNIGFTGYTAGDIWSISLNCDVSPYEMTIRINNSVPGTTANNTDRSVGTYTSARPVFPYIRLADNASDNTWHNFGNPFISNLSGGNSDANGYGDFKYAPPSGYYALCSKNLAEYG